MYPFSHSFIIIYLFIYLFIISYSFSIYLSFIYFLIYLSFIHHNHVYVIIHLFILRGWVYYTNTSKSHFENRLYIFITYVCHCHL